ncbi:hypothetical protein UlMin_035339 [Ulmus minor]
MEYWKLFMYIPIFTALYVFTSHFLRRIQNLPPSPLLSLPIIGHLYLLKKPLHRTFSTISQRFGPIFFLQCGSRPVVVVSSPSAVEECLTKNDIVFANRPRKMIVGKILAYNYTMLSWSPYGHHWRNLRRISSLHIFSSHRLQLLSGIRHEEVKSLILKLSVEKEWRIVDAKVALGELMLNIVMRMIAGKRYYGDKLEDLEEAKRFKEIQAESLRQTGKSYVGDFLPFMSWIGVGKGLEKSMIELQGKRDEFIQNLIDQHRRKMEDSNSEEKNKTLIEVLLSLQQTESEFFKDEIIRGLVLVLLLGGTETSASTMEWALSLLLNHQDVLKKVQEEIDNHVGFDRLIDESDLTQLPYLQCIINETLRMYPAAPLLLPHESSQDCTVSGYRIPRGTTLFINLWAIQNDLANWAEPSSFKPERFMGLGGTRDGFRLMPFGSGRRSCPGESLALRVIGLALGSLIQCCEWERPSEEMIDMTGEMRVSMPRARHLQAKCRPRPIMLNTLSHIGSTSNVA